MSKIIESNVSTYDYIESLIAKATRTEQRNTEETLVIAKEALELAKANNFPGLIAKCYIRIGRCHWINSDFDEAINLLREAVEISIEVGDMYTKADALGGLGLVFSTMEIMDQGVAHYNSALAIAEEYGYTDMVTRIFNNLGTIHEDLLDYSVAIDYFRKSMENSLKLEDPFPVAAININMANVYLSLGKMDDAITSITLAKEYAEGENVSFLLGHVYHSLGLIYQKKKEYDKAIDYLLKGVEEAIISSDLVILYKIYIELGNSYDSIDKFEEAKDYYYKAYESTLEIGMDELMPRVYEKLALFYESHSLDSETIRYYKEFYKASKSAEENRRLERIKSIGFQSSLSVSLKETKEYKELSDKLQKSYKSLNVLSKIGQSMTATLKLDDILEQLYDNVNLLMNINGLYVGLLDKEENVLRFDFNIESGKQLDSFTLSLDNEKSMLVWGFLHNQTIKINDAEEEYQKYIKGLASTRGELMYSAMYSPLMVEGEVIGMFSIQAKEKNAFTESHKDLLQTLSAYLAIAIKNAKQSIRVAKLNKQLKSKSEHDGLTGIPNRRLFDEVYDKLWIESIHHKSELSVLILDIDNFKYFNDTFGHLVGDEVIKSVAKLLNDQKRSDHDFVARYGGDEFIAILPICSKEEAKKFADSLSKNIRTISNTLDIDVDVTLSIGIATTIPKEITAKKTLIYTADNQLYLSKANGKNQASATEL